jgi:hypothetical protein
MRKQYGWGVRGWGASQNNPMSALIKSSSLYLSADKADGQPFVKLEPRTLPNGVSNGEYTQNVSGDWTFLSNQIIDIQSSFNYTNIDYARVNKPADSAVFNASGASTFNKILASIPEFSTLSYDNANFIGKITSGADTQRFWIGVPKGTTLEQARTLLAGIVIRYQLATPIDTLNVPFKNPWTDLKGVVGKNLFDLVPHVTANRNLSASGFNVSGVYLTSSETALKLNLKPNTQYTLSLNVQIVGSGLKDGVFGSFRLRDSVGSRTFNLNGGGIEGNIISTFTTPSDVALYTTLWLYGSSDLANTTVITNLQLELGSTATAYEPYGKSNCLLQAFAGTTADGYTVQTINGKTNTFLNLDGLDSFGQFANMDVLNPVGTDDFCQMVVFRPDDTALRFYGITRNTAGNPQYGLLNGSGGNLRISVNAILTDLTTSVTSLSYVVYGRINGVLFAIFNGIELINTPYATAITGRPNTQLGCRSASEDGLTKTGFSKGLQGDIAFWKGAQGTLDKDKIVSLVAKAMKQKYNLGV